MKVDGITLSKAYNIWSRANVFNHKVYEIMKYMIEKDKVKVLINRNPTLNFYSMLLMTIRDVIKSDMDYNMATPLGILRGLNADFDGRNILPSLNLFNCWELLTLLRERQSASKTLFIE